LKGKISKDSLTDLITSEKLPPTIEFNDQNSQKIFSSGIEKQLLLIANEKDLKADADLFKAYRKVIYVVNAGFMCLCGSSRQVISNLSNPAFTAACGVK
jgi:hypothetical protein